MTGIWVSQASAVPSPTDVAAYLRQHGWALKKADTDWSFFEKDLQGEQVVLEVPQRASTTSYSRLLATLLDDLSRLEARPPAVVLRGDRRRGRPNRRPTRLRSARSRPARRRAAAHPDPSRAH